jgi:hypothetical protein
MKFFIVFLLGLSFVYGAEAENKGDLTNLFKRLDTAIATNKNGGAIEDDKNRFKSESMAEREKNYKEFNEAAKKFHLFRAKTILKNVNELIKEYKNKVTDSVTVQRYSAIGNVKFAYVSGVELDTALTRVETNGNIYKNLTKYKKLLSELDDYDIKTIAKVLIIVEQEMMNLMNVGVKKDTQMGEKKEIADLPMQVKINQRFKSIEVVDIDKNRAKLKMIM